MSPAHWGPRLHMRPHTEALSNGIPVEPQTDISVYMRPQAMVREIQRGGRELAWIRMGRGMACQGYGEHGAKKGGACCSFVSITEVCCKRSPQMHTQLKALLTDAGRRDGSGARG